MEIALVSIHFISQISPFFSASESDAMSIRSLFSRTSFVDFTEETRDLLSEKQEIGIILYSSLTTSKCWKRDSFLAHLEKLTSAFHASEVVGFIFHTYGVAAFPPASAAEKSVGGKQVAARQHCRLSICSCFAFALCTGVEVTI